MRKLLDVLVVAMALSAGACCKSQPPTELEVKCAAAKCPDGSAAQVIRAGRNGRTPMCMCLPVLP